MPKLFAYGNTVVQVHNGYVHTTLPDGATVHALPMHRMEDYARAAALGYGYDLWAMTRDHDHLHALLCHALGLRESPALRETVLGWESELTGAEECAVLAIQKFINLCRQQGLLPASL